MTNATSQTVSNSAFTHANALFARRYPAETRSTNDLWVAACSALLEKRWGEARKELDALGRRTDVAQRLPDAESCGCPAHLVALIQDRIDMIHFRMDRPELT